MATVVEAPLTFFQEPIKTGCGASMASRKMALRLIPKVPDAVNVMAAFADEHLAVIRPSMMKLGHIQHVIDLKAVRMHNTVGQYFHRG